VEERCPPPLLLAATADVLRRHAPFDAMASAELELLAAALKLRYFARGVTILAPADGVVRELFILQRGVVEATAADPGADALAATLVEGEMFPIGALTGRRATALTYKSAHDTFAYILGEAEFHAVMAASPAFHAFCTQRLATLLEQSTRSVRAAFAARASGELGMAAALRTAVRRPAVTLTGEATIRDALTTMSEQRIGSVVLVDGGGAPEGIFTRTDVLDRVALAARALDTPLRDVVTAAPVGLDGEAPIAEAAHAMARHGFRHLLVLERGRLAGVVSERDLFALQRRSAQSLRKEIERADSAAWLAAVARESRGLASSLLAQGVGAESLMQMVTALNDALVSRAVTIAAAGQPAGLTGFCWIGLGSEGRMEQTLATDQDNAIIFPDDPKDGVAETRKRLLALAAYANDMLAAAGFPLCRGEIMARNADWCLTLGEWKARFDDWTRNAGPQALLNAAIFFDFRPLAGDAALARALRDHVRAIVPPRAAFLRQMAVNALATQPPGFFDTSALDLKLHASRPFVDAARVLALAAGLADTSTVERLRSAGPRFGISGDDLEAAVQSFLFVQQLRLRRQEEARDAAPGDRNRVDPRNLNPLDRRILKEALRQARKLQNRVAVEYQV
jgi:CBS domain-containing protein